MKRLFYLVIITIFLSYKLCGQEFDISFTSSESGTQLHVARNSVTLGPGYTYTPSGGSLTIEIQNPVVLGTTTYSSTPVDPEARALNTSYMVGATNGSFNVNPMGGANYNIPLELLPGVNGLSPSLSLVYSSNSSSGIAGYGWQISGLSSIARGPQTYYHDGAAKGIELAITDRFYLDGQRLVPASGTYGDAGAVYRTDNDIFTRVTPQATNSDGPGWFKAETKSGLIFEYGNTTASKQRINGYNHIVNWYVSKVSDLFGNHISFAYIRDNYSVLPAEITYGPNTITFFYKTRTDKTSSYLKGAKIEQWLLLDKITVKYNSNVIKTYEFKYTSQGPYYNFYSNLNEIIEYGIGSSRLNSTAITYQIPANVSFQQTMYNTSHQYVTYKSKLYAGDFDGDGKADFLCLPDVSNGATWTGLKVYFSDGNDNFTNSFSQSTLVPSSGLTLRDVRTLDINGDGKDDVLYEEGTSSQSTFKYMISNGNSFSTPSVITINSTNNSKVGISGKRNRNEFKQEDDNEFTGLKSTFLTPFLVEFEDPNHPAPQKSDKRDAADYNGDGVNDIFINSPGGNWKILSFVNSSGQMTSSLNTLGSGTITTLVNEVLSGDFNGDGKADLWSFEGTGVKIYTFTGSALSQIYSSTWPSNKHFFNLGDFNGDGKVDVFLYGYGRDQTEYDWSEWQIQLSTGTGFEGASFPKKKNNLKDDYVRVSDFNGDGATDVMVTSADLSWNGTYFYISKNHGTDFYPHYLSNYPLASHNYNVADFNGDGNVDFICTDGVLPWWTGYQVYRTSGNTSILMEKVGNGLGVVTKPGYIRLSQASSVVYQRGTGAVYPISDFQGPWTVVSSLLVDNGKGSYNTINYYYEGAKIHLQGKGFLGYIKSRVSDVTASIESENVITNGFNTTYFYPNVHLEFSKRLGTTDTIEKTKSSFTHYLLNAATKRIFVYPQNIVQTNKLTGHRVTTTTSSYDGYGNPMSVVKAYLNGPTETTITAYDNIDNPSTWLLGRPASTTLEYTGGGSTIERYASRTFSATSNNLNSETWHQGTSLQITKGFKYKSTGALLRDSVTANGIYRTNIYTYETDNIRVKTIKNPLSHTITNTYDNYGRLLTQADFLNNTITNSYDALGRIISVSTTDGSQDSVIYKWESPNSNPKYGRYSVRQKSNDGSESKDWLDKFGRTVRSDSKGFDGTWIYNSKRYNLKGQVDSISDPYFSSGNPLWNKYQFDNYGRISSLTRPTGRNSSWGYNNNVVTETTAGRSFIKTYSSDGTVSSAQDPGGTINYTYFPDGKVKTITAPGGIVTSMHYDNAGNQTQLIDPSAGTINYTYNGFGELVSQTNARSQIITVTYHSYGAIKRKETPEGYIKYRYNSNKQLVNINSYGSVSHTYSYDSKGRVISVIDTISGTSPLTTSFTYDSYGRVSTITHPTGITETNNYNGNGYLSSISAGGSTRWTITSMNARQQVTAGRYGSNLNSTYGFDAHGYPSSTVTGTVQDYSYNFNTATGNLNWRQNNKYSNLKETFYYDNLDRLDNVYMGTGTPVLTLDMAYDSNKGGITTKTDAGTMFYNTPGKPYALSGISPTTGLVPSNNQSISYTSFESISTISENNYVASFTYNPQGQRAEMVVQQNGNTTLTRWYSGSSYIKETEGAVTRQYTFIGGDAYTAPVVAIKTGTGTPVYYYLLRDYLGNITHVVNTSNTVVAEYSYDAWGRMRNKSTWEYYAPGTEPALFVAGRGFTGHEHLPWFNVINMNGRVYDPLIGQFLSPDNFVQSPDFTQNFNRYAYCLNNPLVYTDPDGEIAHLIIGAIIGGFINLATHLDDVDNAGEFFGYFGIGALAGALGAGVGAGVSSSLAALSHPALGSVGSAFTSGFVGTATKAATGGAAGFISGAASGFSSGFISGSGNAFIEGENALSKGWNYAKIGAFFGGISGAITGGIDAAKDGRHFLTGAPKQHGIVKINQNGTSDFIGYGDYDPKNPNIVENYKTSVAEGKYITTDDYNVYIKTPKSIDKITQIEADPLRVSAISGGKNTTRVLTWEPLDKITIHGYRYRSTYPIDPRIRLGSLFHWRPITPFMKKF